MNFLPIDDQLAAIRRGAVEIVPEQELIDKLKRSYDSGKPLRIKLGCDPTRPDLHLGHSVILRKLRQFQDLGHHAILIIGDFTGMIGDPSGQNKTRPSLTIEDVRANGKTYFEQASKILDPEKTEIVYNADWLSPLTFADVIRLCSKFTIARMMERDDFTNRYTNNEPISLHEFLYPVAQGMDSVHLKSDVELGGTDQKFNLLVGRQLQKEFDLEPQVCLMMPLLVGSDGVKKMSKSYDNYIGIDEQPNDMYGKCLSIPDDLIYTWFELVTDVSNDRLEDLKTRIPTDPRNTKHELAWELTRLYHGEDAANEARNHFEQTVINKEIPDDMPEFELEPGTHGLVGLIRDIAFATSGGEARRLVQQGGVSIDGSVISDPGFELSIHAGDAVILKVGKRKYGRLVVKTS
jgi:tyrosyl-tRNA synthetase